MTVQPPQGPEQKHKESSPIERESSIAILLKSKGPRLKDALNRFQYVRANEGLKIITKSHFV